jgi:hypothetical protein
MPALLTQSFHQRRVDQAPTWNYERTAASRTPNLAGGMTAQA